MPKDNSERIIDWPYSPTKSRSGTVSSGGGGGGGGGGATNLDALTDVTVSAPANGQVLTYDAATGQWKNSAAVGGGAPSPHGLSSIHHNSTLNWSLINFAGSNLTDIATRLHANLQGIGPNDHHNQQHLLVGPDHTASGLTAGQTIRANSPTGYAWALLDHTDLNPASITPDQHHRRAHDIITGDVAGAVHTIVGAAFQVVGATGTNVLGLLTPSFAPGAAAAILRTSPGGGIQLDTDLLYVDAVNNRVGINKTPGSAALDVQVSALADHSQRIKQVAGQSGRMWRLEDIPGNELIVVDSVGNMQSGQPGFVSGLTGWQISYLGNAEFNNIWARGELHATVFVKDEVHVGGGTILVASGGKLHSQANIDSTHADIEPLEIVSSVPGVSGPLTIRTTSGAFSGTTLDIRAILNYLEIDDPPSGPGFYFTQGDVVRSKTEVSTGVTDFWLEVNNPKQFTGYSRYSVIKRSGTDGPLPAGSGVGSYGKPGDGRILLTSDLNYAPYLDVFTVGPNVWTGAAGSIVPRVRLGQLMGVGVPGVSGISQYGIVAGTDLSNANAPYFIASDLQFKLYKINITLNDGTNDTAQINQNGSLVLGKNIAVDAGKSFQVINGTGTSSDGNVILGNKTLNNYVEWNNNTGVLTVVGAIAVPGGGASTAYVDAQDAANRKRNVIAVTGSWSVTGPASVSWGSPNAVFVNLGGINYAITAGSLGGLSALTWYLYVDTSTAAPFTVQATTNSSVLGVDMVVIAVFAPGTTFGSITLMGGTTVISGSNIITGTIIAAHLTTGSVTADKIWAGVGITLGVIGAINGGTKTFGAGAGFFLGYDAGVYKFDIGNTTDYLRWDGSNLSLGNGGIGGILSVGINGAVRSGTKTYGASIAGFFLGYDAGAPAGFKFDVGSSTNYLHWDGSALTIQARTLLMSIEGNMAINANGSISGGGKTYGVGTGFFLGQSGGAGNYQFDIGNASNFLRFDGSTLFINANNIAAFNAAGGTNLLSLATTGLAVTFDVITNPVAGSGAALQITAPVNVSGGSGFLRANKLINTGSTMQIENFRTDLTTSSPGLGNTGEIAWVRISGIDYLYLCYQGSGATAQWKRVQMNTF